MVEGGVAQTGPQGAGTAIIRHTQFLSLHAEISRCRELSRRAGEPQCISLEGVAGAGKSWLVRDYARNFPRVETAEGTEVPVLYVELPKPATIKTVVSTMLAELGDPAADKGEVWRMNRRLVHLIRECKVSLVILDEFGHLIDKDTNRVLEEVSDWLKTLIKQTNVPFLVVGVSGSVDRILGANSQLARLFARRKELAPFVWDEGQPEALREFRAFVATAERAVGAVLSGELPRREMLYRLHYATDGVVANVMNLLFGAAATAAARGATELTLADLAAEFDQRLSKQLPGKENPFRAGAGERWRASGGLPADGEGATGKRSRARKPLRERPGDVLRTR